jgi:rubredoxin
MNQTLNNLFQLASRLVAVQEQARSLGIFVGDRELLECPQCGLMEDVIFTGQLITCRPSAESPDTEDTGLRFEELPQNRFRCPACGSLVQEGLAATEADDDVAINRQKKGATHA